MPFIVPAGTTLPPAPTVVVSMDGILTATLDAAFAGVQLFASFDEAVTVRFSRQDGTPVRSGSPAPAIAGEALAYDHEMPLGVATAWTATAFDGDGNVIETSDPVTVTVPAQTAITDVWLKSVTNPSLSLKALAVNGVPSMTYSARQSFSDVVGSAYPVGSFDVWSAGSSDWVFLVQSAAERAQLMECLESGVVLVQTHPLMDFDDMYLLAGDITRSYAGSALQVDQIIGASLTQVERPSVEGSPLLQPGRTWRWVVDHFDTWDTLKAAYGSWLGVAGLPIED